MKRRIAFHMNSRKLIGKLILLILGSAFWIAAIMNQAYISDYHGAVSIRYQEPVLTAREMDHMIEEMLTKEAYNIPEVTLWQRDENRVLTNEERNASVSVGLITVAGDMARVYPNSLLYGSYLSQENEFGCMIDRDTAYQLFHTENAVGLTIRLEHKDYMICGILWGTGSNIMIVQEEKQVEADGGEKKYSCMELVFSDTDNARYLAETFVQTNGLGTPTAYIDGYKYQKLSYLLIHIPLWFSAIALVIYLARKVHRLKASRVLFVSGWLGIFLLSAILIKVTNVHIYYSSSMLPTLWSDFDFWGNQWKLFRSSFNRMEGNILYYNDIILMKRMLLVLGGIMLAVVTEMAGLKGNTGRSDIVTNNNQTQ